MADVSAISAQFVDDILDFTSSSSLLGKPALNDLASGIATAPVLFAAREHPVRCFQGFQGGAAPNDSHQRLQCTGDVSRCGLLGLQVALLPRPVLGCQAAPQLSCRRAAC